MPVNRIIVFNMSLGSYLDEESTDVSEAGATGNTHELVKCGITLHLTSAKFISLGTDLPYDTQYITTMILLASREPLAYSIRAVSR